MYYVQAKWVTNWTHTWLRLDDVKAEGVTPMEEDFSNRPLHDGR